MVEFTATAYHHTTYTDVIVFRIIIKMSGLQILGILMVVVAAANACASMLLII